MTQTNDFKFLVLCAIIGAIATSIWFHNIDVLIAIMLSFAAGLLLQD